MRAALRAAWYSNRTSYITTMRWIAGVFAGKLTLMFSDNPMNAVSVGAGVACFLGYITRPWEEDIDADNQ